MSPDAAPDASVPPTTAAAQLSRDDIALNYLEQLPFAPYPVQEQALAAWFDDNDGVLVCAPTGTGKTLIAEAAAYEALHTGKVTYYTTPLIALTEQKFVEMQAAATRWGFSPHDVGLVTGNRKVNPQAKVLVVVAEILLNRLLQPDHFQFDQVSSVVMDEFHSFSDAERGIVWEFALALLPAHVRVLLLSATVGNAVGFSSWLQRAYQRAVRVVQSSDRKVPLSFQWVPDQFLNEQLEYMAQGDELTRRTPALVFCFNREECWQVAEELKGKALLASGQQDRLVERLEAHDWSRGAGPKLKRILMRGVGVHHAGLLPRYRRIVEELFQEKLLSICVCTETLAAGINLPARSVVVPALMKGPAGKQRLIEASDAQQIFGRAGRPQFDQQGFVYALPHEDDVRIFRWKEKYDQIPEDTRDPALLQAKKALKKKMPTRSSQRQYWNEAQFQRLITAAPRDLTSQGELPWRMLAYMLQLSPDVNRVRELIRRRLLDPKRMTQAELHLDHMLRVLQAAEIVQLEPKPPAWSTAHEKKGETADPTATDTALRSDAGSDAGQATATDNPAAAGSNTAELPASSGRGAAVSAKNTAASSSKSTMGDLLREALAVEFARRGSTAGPKLVEQPVEAPVPVAYRAEKAFPTPKLDQFFLFRSVNPVYAMFLVEQFAVADPAERLQLLESVLELPKSLLRHVRVPSPDRMPPGTLAATRIDPQIVQRGLLSADDLYPPFEPDLPPEERRYPPPLAEKVRILFDSEYPHVHGVVVQPVWAAGALLEYGCNFQQYISTHDLSRQEGLIFRHLLRLVLLIHEFAEVTPPNLDPIQWRTDLRALAEQFAACCRDVDPTSTDAVLAHSTDADPLLAELPQHSASHTNQWQEVKPVVPTNFGAGLG